jgi:cytochrome P450
MQTSSSATPQQYPLPPKTKGFPVVGALPTLLREQLAFLENARAKYGDIYTLDLGPMSMVMLNHPDFAQYVLRDNAKNYSKGGPIWDSVRSLIGNGLVVSEGDFWLRQRRMMSPHFHRQRLGALTEVMVEAISERLKDWERMSDEGQPVDVSREFQRITMEVIMRTMFGGGMSEKDFNEMGEAISFAINFMLQQAVTTGIPQWVPIPGRAHYKEILETVDKFIFKVIADRRETRSNDLISMLLDSVDDESGDGMTNQQLRDEVLTIFAAGYETTALVLSWVLHFATQQPEIMTRLEEETREVLGRRKPTLEDLPKLQYNRQVLQEAMRLYPPAYFVTRTAVEDDVIGGYQIKAGQTVSVTMYTIHRHPDFWESPETFDADRFSPENSEGRHQAAWIPFGIGQRMCLGRDFAYMEGSLILSMLVQRCVTVASGDFVARPKFAMTLRPEKGVLVDLKSCLSTSEMAAIVVEQE